MGKKSRRKKPSQQAADPAVNAAGNPLAAPSVTPSMPIAYSSDGPSDVELLQTTSSSLQAKLNQLTELGLANDRAAFVQQFVPLDLSPADVKGYLEDLTIAEEAEGQWRNLVAEIAAIRSGRGVDRIEGDQMTRASFFFRHPLLENCDREVTFVCIQGQWRAEG